MGWVTKRRQHLLLSGAAALLALVALPACTTTGPSGGPVGPSSGAATPLVSSARSLLARGTLTDVQASIPVFQTATTAAGESKLQAYTGLGDAYVWLAQNNPGSAEANYDSARAAYAQAVAQAGTTSGDDVAAAHAGQAKALLALHGYRGSRPAAGRDQINYLATAITEYTAAVNAAANKRPEWYYELANAYRQSNNNAAAITAYQNGAALQPGTTQASAALLEVASLQSTGPIPTNAADDAVLQTLIQAKNANPRSAATRTMLGRRYFDRGSFDSAREEFTAALSADPNTTTGLDGTSYLADANYYLSVLAANGSGANAAQVVSYAQAAIDAGGGELRHRRQLCLSHILRADQSFVRGESLSRCQLGDTAQGRLLLGMYYLRLAQFRNPTTDINNPETSRWIGDLTAARDQFQDSRELAAATSTTDRDRTLDWAGLSSPLATVDAADYGVGRVSYCAGQFAPLFGAAPAAGNEATARSFFARYRLTDCDN
jgi:tetratricopeptide (TPR) repeat protein